MSAVSAITNQAVGTPTAAQLAAMNAATGAEGGQTTLGENDFLKLLTVQLQSQDPLQPMQDTEFISQMATFSSLSEMTSLNSNFSNFTQGQTLANAESYIGKTVSVDSGNGSTSGAVTGVSVSNGTPQITINGSNYDLSNITAILGTAAAASTTATGSTAASTSTN